MQTREKLSDLAEEKRNAMCTVRELSWNDLLLTAKVDSSFTGILFAFDGFCS